MGLDIKKRRESVKNKSPSLNFVPLIDILFTLLIFMAVMAMTTTASLDDSASQGKPESQTGGDAEYYLIPVSGLKTVTVNGVDRSSLIRNNAIAVHTDVIDEGEILIKPKTKSIIITAPSGMSIEKAAISPPNQ